VLSAKILFLVQDNEVATVLLLSFVMEFVFEFPFELDKEFDKSVVRELDNVPSNKFVNVLVNALAKVFVMLFVAELVFELLVTVVVLLGAVLGSLAEVFEELPRPLFISHCIEAVANLFNKTFFFIILLPCCNEFYKHNIYYSWSFFLIQKKSKVHEFELCPLIITLCKLQL